MSVLRVWEEISKEKCRVLEGEYNGTFLSVGDLSQFECSLQAICSKYSDEAFTKVFSRIEAGLENVRSFAQAITACTQASGVASLIWGAGLILIEVCVLSSYQIYSK